MADGYGSITWWGFSPALDLQQSGLSEMCKKTVCSTPDELNILLVGAGDIRYILMTLAKRYKHPKRKLKFYVIESALELYARDMLLMMIALEKQANMGLQEKTELFLELYGNCLIRRQSSNYVEKMAHELIKMVTDFEVLEQTFPLFDLTQLKYKERDFLEGILKYWRNREQTNIEISKCWDLRLRQQLGVRYDSRLNAFDWDYSMEMCDRGGSIVYLPQYKHWRNSGVAFEIREGTYNVPNRTVVSGTIFKQNGERHPRRGYWGDMVVSPYITFGVETEEKSFYKKSNNMHVKTAEDVSVFNVTSLFHELLTNEKYELPKTEEKEVKTDEPEHATLEEIIEEEENEESNEKPQTSSDESRENDKNENKDESETNPNTENHEWFEVEDARVVFLPLGSLPDMLRKDKYKKLFNVVYFSNSMVHLFKPEVKEIFADRAAVIVETALFMLQLKKENVKEFVQKVSGFASAAGCQPLEHCDELQDAHAMFYFEREYS